MISVYMRQAFTGLRSCLSGTVSGSSALLILLANSEGGSTERPNGPIWSGKTSLKHTTVPQDLGFSALHASASEFANSITFGDGLPDVVSGRRRRSGRGGT